MMDNITLTHVEEPEQKDNTKKKGIGFTWKNQENDEIFKASLENWKKNTGNTGGAQDFILWMIANANKQNDDSTLMEQAIKIGADQILQAHQARKLADERMIQTIIDIIASSKETAELRVTAEINSLRATINYLKTQCENLENENTYLKNQLIGLQRKYETISNS